jgi:DNA-binding transcriptional ArsR family regulator
MTAAPTTAKEQREKANRNRLKAMSHPLRAKILKLLIEKGELSPAEAGKELGVDSPLVSHHIKRLVGLDCAELIREEKAEGTGAVRHVYRPIVRHLVDTDEWAALPQEVKEGLLPEFFQPGVDDFTAAVKAGFLYDDENWHITRTPLVLDSEGMHEALEAFEACRLAMSAIETRSAQRRSESGEAGKHISSSLNLFEIPPP